MTELLTLDKLADMAGEDKGLSFNRKNGKFEDPFRLGLAYLVEITEQTISSTKNGYTQVALKLSIVKSDGSMGRSSFRWLTLPVFSSEKKAAEDPEKLEQLKAIFGERLYQLLRAVDPDTFTIARMEKIGTTWKFYDANGDEMSKTAKTAREKQVGKAVVGTAMALVSEQLSLVGRRLYYVRTQDRDSSTKFYDNFFSEQPTKYEAANV